MDLPNKFVQRRSRILAIQKRTLVQLVRNHFIRYFGSHVNANFNAITPAFWEKFAIILNSLGPPKTANQWKNSFSCMSTRIRNKAVLIHQLDANSTDNLSIDDLQIYEMLPIVDFESISNTLFQDDSAVDSGNVGTQNASANMEVHMELSAKKTNSQITKDAEHTKTNNLTVVFQNDDEMEVYADETVEDDFSDDLDGMIDDNIVQAVSSQHESLKNVDQSSQKTVKPVVNAKTNSRIPDCQKERLVQLIQNNSFKLFGRFAGANGVAIKTQTWGRIAKELNQLGPARTADQWKATFNTIKASAKSKLADNHNGSPAKSLNRLEEKIIANYGLDSMDGHQRLGEAGFSYSKTVPAAGHVEIPRNNSTASLKRSQDTLNRSKSSQVNSTATSGAYEAFAVSSSDFDRENPSPRSSEEDIVLQDILREICDNDNHEQETETVQSSSTVRHASSNTIRNAARSRTNITPEASRRYNQSQSRVQSQRDSACPRSSEEDMVLQDILREIRDNDNREQETETVQSSSTVRHASSNTIRNAARSRTNITPEAFGRYSQSQGDSAPRLINGPNSAFTNRSGSLTRESLTRPNISTISRIHHQADVRGRENGQNARARNSSVFHDDDDNEPSDALVQRRDRSYLRNRYTSYDMVQRSMQQQELFIEEHGRNHTEMMYLIDRNHTEMVGMFTATLKALTEVGREFLKK